jgi:hypothetical protein
MHTTTMSLRSAVLALLGFLSGCGSIVESIEEKQPPVYGSKMEGTAYWLPKGSILIEGTWDKDAAEPVLKVSGLVEADTSSRWRLTRKINHLFEDTVALEVDATTGLLKTVNGTSEDQTAEIAAAAVAAAANAMTLGAGGVAASSTSARMPTSETPCPDVTLRTPFRFRIAATDLRSDSNRGFCQTLHVKGVKPKPETPAPAEPKPGEEPQQGESKSVETPAPELTFTLQVHREYSPDPVGKRTLPRRNKGSVDGIVVRAPAPYQVTLKNGSTGLEGEQTVFLPDPDRVYWLPLDRTPFVKNETKIALLNGVVQSVTTTRPSIILGIVGIPKTILSALVPLP